LSFRKVEIRLGIGPLVTSRLWLCGVDGMDVDFDVDFEADIGVVNWMDGWMDRWIEEVRDVWNMMFDE
jgi:hypothetical protein